MAHTAASTEKLHEALANLNEAVRDRREEIQQMVTEKYADLRSAFDGATQASAGWVREQSREVSEKARLAANTVDTHVRQHPWSYVGGAAVTGLLIGMLAARRR